MQNKLKQESKNEIKINYWNAKNKSTDAFIFVEFIKKLKLIIFYKDTDLEWLKLEEEDSELMTAMNLLKSMKNNLWMQTEKNPTLKRTWMIFFSVVEWDLSEDKSNKNPNQQKLPSLLQLNLQEHQNLSNQSHKSLLEINQLITINQSYHHQNLNK